MTSTLQPPHGAPIEPKRWSRKVPWLFAPSGETLFAIALGGVAFDLAVRHPVGLMSFAAVGLTIGAARGGGWVQAPLARRLLTLALLPAAMLLLRASPWLVPFNIAAVIALLALAAVVRDEDRAIGRAVGRMLRPVSAIEPMSRSTDLLRNAGTSVIHDREDLLRRVRRLATGVALALPVFVALLSLLAASDALFSSWLSFPVDIPATVGHGLAIVVGATLMTAWAAQAGWPDLAPPARIPSLVGGTEAAIVLGSVVLAFGAFVAAQLIAVASGPAYVERTTGLTYAEYAREGFFQLVAAAVMTLVVLTSLRRIQRPATPRTARWISRFEMATVVLTLGIVGIAIRRLFLYEAEFGLTMLRLSTIVFAAFIGFVFLVTGAHLSGRLPHSPIGTILAGALVTLIAVNLANPEAIVAQRNLDRFGGTAELDVDYLITRLGTDAYPAIATDAGALAALCRDRPTIDDRLITYNLSRRRGAQVCGS